MEFWLTEPDGTKLGRLIVSQDSLQVLTDDDLLRKVAAWLARRRQSEWWSGSDSMWTFLHDFSLSAENGSLPIQVRFI